MSIDIKEILKKRKISKEDLHKINNWLIESGVERISYIKLAVEYEIPFSRAHRILKAIAEFYPDKWFYDRGELFRKEEIKFEI